LSGNTSLNPTAIPAANIDDGSDVGVEQHINLSLVERSTLLAVSAPPQCEQQDLVRGHVQQFL
jgi:hypothetical protein